MNAEMKSPRPRVSDRGEVRLLLVWGVVLLLGLVVLAVLRRGRSLVDRLREREGLFQNEADRLLYVPDRLPAGKDAGDETQSQSHDADDEHVHCVDSLEKRDTVNAGGERPEVPGLGPSGRFQTSH